MLEKITAISAIKQIQTKNGLSDKITIQTAEHGTKYLSDLESEDQELPF